MNNHDKFKYLSLLITALGIVATMFISLSEERFYGTDGEPTLALLTLLMVLLGICLFLFVLLPEHRNYSRKKPLKTIYFSFSEDSESCAKIAFQTKKILTNNLPYSVCFLSYKDIYIGENMHAATVNNIASSDLAIIIISNDYFENPISKNEFEEICKKDKKIIPIIYEYEGALPDELINIKSLTISANNEISKNQLHNLTDSVTRALQKSSTITNK